MCSKCPPPARTLDLRWSLHWSVAASITFCLESTQVRIKRFWRSQMSLIFVSYTHCCITPQILWLQVHFDEVYTIHLLQFSLVMTHCNITFSLFRLSQGSVATLIRWGAWSLYYHMYRSSLNLTVKTALKFVDFSRNYGQKWVGSFFMAHGVDCRKFTSLLPRLVLGWMTIFGWVNHPSIKHWATQANSASYAQWDGRWVPAKVRWCSALGSKTRMAHYTCG